MIAAAAIFFSPGVTMTHAAENSAPNPRRPNIVFILADDLGPGDVGYNGQKYIRTPNIDALAKQGMRFTQAYSGSPVCAPARCSMLSGLHSGHCYIRDNKEIKPEGQWPIPQETVTVAKLLKQSGYATACIGKWGLGFVGTSGDPLKQGFDFFYGHNCQRVAHNHYADHVYRNDDRVDLDGKQYIPDLMADEAVTWMREHKSEPCFLYFATTLPHVSLQAPEDAIAKYRGKLGPEEPFAGKGDYPPCREPKATFAAMVNRLDDHVGRIMREIETLGLDENTLIVFASDNGPTFKAVGVDPEFFGSALGRRGLKEDVYEGGIRVPMVVRWKNKIAPGTASDHVTALYDLLPTFIDLAGAAMPSPCDGISILPTLRGHAWQKTHEYLYWEFGPKAGQRALRKGNWKAVQVGLKKNPQCPIELYDLSTDPAEKHNVADEHPEVVTEMAQLMRQAHSPSPIAEWNF